MPQPTPGDVHVNTYLTNISVAYLQEPNKFVADKVFPRVPVEKQSNYYATFTQADFMRDDMTRRAPGSETAGVGYRLSKDSYSCEVWGLHIDVDDQTVANADSVFSPYSNATQILTQKEMIKREVRWATKYFATSVWTGGLKKAGTAGDLVSGTDFVKWSDVTSTPLEDVANQQMEIEAKTGFLPQNLVLTRRGWESLKNHPDIVDRTKYTSSSTITTGVVASLMELDNIYVAAGIQNTAQEGLTGSYNYILGNHALLLYTTPAPALMSPTAGYVFVWNGYLGMAEGRRMKDYRMEELAAQRLEIESTYDMKVVAAGLGAFFQNIV